MLSIANCAQGKWFDAAGAQCEGTVRACVACNLDALARPRASSHPLTHGSFKLLTLAVRTLPSRSALVLHPLARFLSFFTPLGDGSRRHRVVLQRDFCTNAPEASRRNNAVSPSRAGIAGATPPPPNLRGRCLTSPHALQAARGMTADARGTGAGVAHASARKDGRVKSFVRVRPLRTMETAVPWALTQCNATEWAFHPKVRPEFSRQGTGTTSGWGE
jgi:hypothetical protein